MIIGRDIVRLGQVGSTMDEIDLRAKSGAAEGLIVVADEQTSGRGRMGRSWVAPPGSALLCSILLRPKISPEKLGPLSPVIGIAVARAIESVVGVACQLKWPNDVWINGEKVAGILIQSRLQANGIDFVVVGIGINLTVPEQALPEGATSVLKASGRAVDRDEMLVRLVQEVQTVYDRFVESDGKPDLDEWRIRALMLGEEVSIVHGDREVLGRMLGIDDAGNLMLETESGTVATFSSGEIHRGPRIQKN